MSDPTGPAGAFERPRGRQGAEALEKEARLPLTGWQQEVEQGHRYGLEAAESIVDRRISTFSRGELPHYAGINTFMKAPYIEDVNRVGEFDVAVVGVPHDSGTTYRPGTRFGPQGIRRISALYTPYNYEMGVDLREQIRLCDVGDIFTIPANNEKSFDQISKGIAHIFASGAFPIILGGDHSIGFPTVRGVCRHLGDKKVGIIHFDRHVEFADAVHVFDVGRLHEGVDARVVGQLATREGGDAPVDDALGRFQAVAVGLVDLLLPAGEGQGQFLLEGAGTLGAGHATGKWAIEGS